jgi:hypothetical protein
LLSESKVTKANGISTAESQRLGFPHGRTESTNPFCPVLLNLRMVSTDWYSQPLLEKGFFYLVKEDLFHLKKGMRVRVINAQHHQAPKSDDGGFIIDFPDLPSLSLHHECDRATISTIGTYFEKQEPFDWDAALLELKKNRAEAIAERSEEIKTDTFKKNRRAQNLVQRYIAEGMTPKQAYKLAQEKGFRG